MAEIWHSGPFGAIDAPEKSAIDWTSFGLGGNFPMTSFSDTKPLEHDFQKVFKNDF